MRAADKPKRRIEADVISLRWGRASSRSHSKTRVCSPNGANSRQTNSSKPKAKTARSPACSSAATAKPVPRLPIKAIGAGKVAARNIDEYLGYHHTLDCGVDVPAPSPNDRAPKGRVEISERPARERKHDFAYVEMPMSREEAVQECGRCLRCDHFGCGALEGGRIQYV